MSRRFMLLAGVSTALFATPAFAQDAAPAEDNVGLEEIVVTAQKREENLQNVPVSVTAIGAEAIANQRITEFSDLTRAASSLTVTQQTSSPNNSIILRGIGTFAFSIGVEPSVAVIIDDMPVVQQAQAFDNLTDLARIEVLKGPQGTLFGKNASAGVVNIVTKDPDQEFGGNVAFTAASDSDFRGEATISGPIGEGAGFRLTGFYHDYKGNIRNLTNGHTLNDQTNYGVRGKIKAGLSENLTLTLTGGYAKATQDGTATTIRSIDPLGTPRAGGVATLPLVPSLTGITPGSSNYNARVDADAPTTNKTASIAGKLDLDLGFANLISVSAYQDWKFNFVNDVDGTDINTLAVFSGGTLSGGTVQSGPYHSTSFTQELRLVSSGSSDLKYVVGGFYANANTDRAFSRGPLPVQLVQNWDSTATSKSAALFAQLDYKLPTGTTVSGGIRYNHEKIGVRFDDLRTTATLNTCATGNPLCRGTHSDNVVTWKGSISQEITPKAMVYASVARGYKGFAYDVSSGFNPARVNAALAGPGGLNGVGPVKSETSTSYELGLKSRFLDNRVQLNVVGFLTDYSNFQAQSAVIIAGNLQNVLNNVGKLRTKGVEVEFSAKPNEWLRFDASAAYTDAKMTSFLGAQGYSDQTGQIFAGGVSTLVGPCTTAALATAAAPRTTCGFQNRSGASLPNSPKFKFNLGATAEIPAGADDGKALITLNYQHQSSVNFDLLGNPLVTQEGYGILNGSVGYAQGRWKVTAFVNNLFDKHYASFLTDGFGGLGGNATNPAHVIYQFHPRDSERYFGMKVGLSF
jgi:iron complex outermembrane recepter protein